MDERSDLGPSVQDVRRMHAQKVDIARKYAGASPTRSWDASRRQWQTSQRSLHAKMAT